MALYQIQVFKNLGAGRKEFSNRYYAQAADLATAAAFAPLVVTADQAMHMPYVRYLRARVSSALPGDNSFAVVPLVGEGTMPGISNALPMENVYRVDFGVFGGLPSRKFYRGPVVEEYQDGGALTAALLSYWGTTVVPLFVPLISTAGTAYLCDEQGNLFNSIDLHPLVANRKLTRKRRKRPDGGGPPVS